MTISPFLIYLWGIAENIGTAFFLCGIVAVFVGVLGAAFAHLEEVPELKSPTKRLAVFGLVALLVSALIPDKKTIAMMVVIPAIANSKVIQQDVPDLYQMAVDALKEAMKPATK